MGRLLALVVDRDAALRAGLQDRLSAQGIEALGAVSETEGREVARARRPDLLFASPGALITECGQWAQRPVAVAVFQRSDELLSSGTRWLGRGADDLLALDAPAEQSDLVLLRVASWATQRERHASLREERRERDGFGGLVGRSAALELIRERLNRLAPLEETIWIEGEQGVGKKWCGRALHQLSSGAGDPFVVLEGPDLETRGWEERLLAPGDGSESSRRTLFLVEPCSYGPEVLERLQRWLLRVAETRPDGLRIVSGSTVTYEDAVGQARLPRPLAEQLAGARIAIPALRERTEDIAPMALHFIRSIERVNQLDPLRLSATALDQLEACPWPGNVRQLRHAIEHAAILADGVIDLQHLPRGIRDGDSAPSGTAHGDLASRPFREAKGEVVSEFERRYLAALMERERGNVTAAARDAGMLRSALQRLLRKHGLKSVDFRRRSTARGGATPVREPRAD